MVLIMQIGAQLLQVINPKTKWVEPSIQIEILNPI